MTICKTFIIFYVFADNSILTAKQDVVPLEENVDSSVDAEMLNRQGKCLPLYEILDRQGKMLTVL